MKKTLQKLNTTKNDILQKQAFAKRYKLLIKNVLIIAIIITLTACNSTKRAQKAILGGNYEKAILLSTKKLRKNKTSKKQQKHILLLEEAFAKAVETDFRNLERYKQDNNPAIIKQIFETYIALDERQELIRPLLPLHIISSNKDAKFDLINYTDQINNSKTTLSNYLYVNAQQLLDMGTIKNGRKAYGDLVYLNKINPNFKDVNKLLGEAHYMGTNFVWVQLENQTNQIIPRRLEDDLLNFDTYGLDEFWTVFHREKEPKIKYQYKLQMLFNRIDVSPERIQEKHTILEKEVKDGFEYHTDSNGNVLRDSLGNGIKFDKYIIVKSDFYEIHQEKASHIEGKLVLSKTGINNNAIETIPLESEFIFVHDFAEMSGDKRALDHYHLNLLQNKEIPFPTDEQMIFDTGEDLKNKLKSIIKDLEI